MSFCGRPVGTTMVSKHSGSTKKPCVFLAKLMSSNRAWAKAFAMLFVVHCGPTGFDVYSFIGIRDVGFCQLVEHLVNEIVLQDLCRIIQLSSNRDDMRTTKFCDTSDPLGVNCCCLHFFNVSVSWFVSSDREVFFLILI